jgi:hypothetical protein
VVRYLLVRLKKRQGLNLRRNLRLVIISIDQGFISRILKIVYYLVIMKEINFNPADFEPVRKIALTFPDSTDSVSHYDTPSIKIKKNLLARLNENGEFFVIRTDFESREHFLEQYPETFFITPHHQPYPYVCMWVNNFSMKVLKEVLETGYKAITAKKKK